MFSIRSKTLRLLAMLALGGLVGITVFRFFHNDSSYRKSAEQAFDAGDFPSARKHAERALQQAPEDIRSLRIGANSALKMGDVPHAVNFLSRLLQHVGSEASLEDCHLLAKLQLRLGRLTACRQTLTSALQLFPEDATAHRKLALLLGDCGYPFLSLHHANKVVELQQADASILALLARNGRSSATRIQLERWHASTPSDEMPINGLLQVSQNQRDAAAAQALLSLVSESENRPSASLSCHCLSERMLIDGFGEEPHTPRLRQLLNEHPNHPGLLTLAADVARANNHLQLQRRCLIRALHHDQWNRQAIHALALSLTRDQRIASNQLQTLEQTLQEIDQLAGDLLRTPDNIRQMEKIADLLNIIGRTDEAVGWGRIAIRQQPQCRWAAQLIRDSARTPWQHPIAQLKAVAGEIVIPRTRRNSTRKRVEERELQFSDQATAAGLKFTYNNGSKLSQQGLKMHQWTGGGVGVLDIDHDSWPDVYFTQGGEFPVNSQQHHSDELFRNLRGQSFSSISADAGVDESRFGQGVGIGDINNDGFDDVYVANVGINRLLINQGDGTLIAAEINRQDAVWTTSVGIADVNGDSQPDLYDVNYARGDGVFTRTCDHDGYLRICGPTDFDAEADRLWLSDGAGDFSNASLKAELQENHGRGMGLIVGALVGRSGNQIYVANDETSNQLYCPNERSRLEDVAPAAGIAFDHYGQAQGSMGIAAGDADSNGAVDLFVTNYYGESNTLYRQHSPFSFLDTTTTAGLSAASYLQLGFGCHFFDAEADGDLDLIVANGHLDDFTHKDQPYRMKPQLFVNDGSGGYTDAVSASEFFQASALGRAVALLDWNGDGRCDFIVGHLDSSAALVTNQSEFANPSASVVCIGTISARVPVGVHVCLQGEKPQHRWLTAGDGYQCSNEKQLAFAHDSHRRNKALVKWPTGDQQTVEQLKPGTNAVIEGRSGVVSIPR